MIVDKSSWSRGRLEQVPNCPACGSQKTPLNVFERRDNDGMMPDLWRMAQCADCHSIWLNPRPDAASLPRAYDSYFTHTAPEADEEMGHGLIWRLIRGYLNRRFDLSKKPANLLGYTVFSILRPLGLKLDYYGRHLTRAQVGSPGRLLDIGCGNGAFMLRAAQMGWQVQGCEIDAKAVAACHAAGLDVVTGDAFSSELDTGKYDVVMMSHVIEHVADQPALLNRAFELLQPGGWLWLACPNPESVGCATFKAAWNGLHQPFHLCIVSQSVILRWIKKIGFIDARLLPRGVHIKSSWYLSKIIASRDGISIPGKIKLRVIGIGTDLMASFSPYKSEETVLMARRPK